MKNKEVSFYDWLDVLNLNLRITRHHNQNRFSCCIEGGETKDDYDDSCLTFPYGNGVTPIDSINEYIKMIEGKILILNAYNDDRRLEYKIPAKFKL